MITGRPCTTVSPKPKNPIISVPSDMIEQVINTQNPDAALLFLTLLAEDDVKSAASRLLWNANRLSCAAAQIKRLMPSSVVQELSELTREPKTAAPLLVNSDGETIYSRKDIIFAMSNEKEFITLINRVESILGRKLAEIELAPLFTIYDFYAMQPDIIELAVSFMLKKARTQGKSSVRMNLVKFECKRWKEKGLTTYDQAESYVKLESSIDMQEWSILSAMGVKTKRVAVESERSHISRWIRHDISLQLIKYAYDIAIFKTGGNTQVWGLVDKILMDWVRNGCKTVEQAKKYEQTFSEEAKKRSSANHPQKQQDFQPDIKRIEANAKRLDELL